MTLKFYKSIMVIPFLLISIQLLSQNKNVMQNGFVSPFKSKSSTQNTLHKATKGTPEEKAYILKKNNCSAQIKIKSNTIVKKEDFFKIVSTDLGIQSDDEMKLIKSEKDELGMAHHRYQQYYKGVKVEGGDYIVHDKSSQVKSANGNFYNNINLKIQPIITKELGLNYAKNNIGAKQYKNEYFLKSKGDTVKYPELVIAAKNGIYKPENFRLCYKYTITATDPYSINDVYIDANTGEIVNKISKIIYANGTAKTMYSGTQSIETEYKNSKYRLVDNTRKIETYNMQNQKDYSQAIDITDADNNWIEESKILTQVTIDYVSTSWWYSAIGDPKPDLYIKIKDASNQVVYSTSYYDNTFPTVSFDVYITLDNPPYKIELWDYDAANADDFGGSYNLTLNTGKNNYSDLINNGTYTIKPSEPNSALDAHWAMGKIYDYYKTTFNRNSFDNLGGTIKTYVHFDQLLANAFWNGVGFTFGDGDNVKEGDQTAIDVCGHEYAHAVTQYSAGLVYQAESGAINEAFSDIFGTILEFYAKPLSANWTCSEETFLSSGLYGRSMSNPKSGEYGPQPNTYNGQYWSDITNLENDHGGVHTNSGVMNYWFYLLCQGGTGTNDKGNSYTITGIGMSKVAKIAYRTLTVYLTSTSNFNDAMSGSLSAAEDLYGIGSTEYWAVKDAWYAVGVANTSEALYCNGTTTYTELTGSFDDGSGSGDYMSNSDCKWLIQPIGANDITIKFSKFDLENTYDSLIVYDGPDSTYNIIGGFTGNTLPSSITSSGGAMLIRLKTDYVTNAGGFELSYNTTGTPYCNGGSILSQYDGIISDGSDNNNYTNNAQCWWLIAPPGATSISLDFLDFDTEQDYDGVAIYDGDSPDAPLLGVYTGSTLPNTITSTGGSMLIVFVSDYLTTYSGWSAYYSTTGQPYCTGITELNDDFGFIDDGSGTENYYNNSDCQWLIKPTDASAVTLFFDTLDIEKANTDGTIYDALEVYDGIDTTGILLGKYYGNKLPSNVTALSGSMYLRFNTDMAETASGWSVYYSSTSTSSCNEITNLTTESGTLSDGSGSKDYSNNSNCMWLIQPKNAASITLNFKTFDTEQDYDGVIIYDGSDTTANILGEFTGNTLPSAITSTGSSMLVWFVSDEMLRKSGWSAEYSSVLTDVENISLNNRVNIYPNPVSDKLTVELNKSNAENIYLNIYSSDGKLLFENKIEQSQTNYSLKEYASGLYFIKIFSDKDVTIKQITKQ